jgi:hypothetical protein
LEELYAEDRRDILVETAINKEVLFSDTSETVDEPRADERLATLLVSDWE